MLVNPERSTTETDGDGSQISNVLFDLDGTLIDHFHAIYRSYQYVQEKLGLPPASYEKVRATVGGGIHLTLQRLTGEQDIEEYLVHYSTFFDTIKFEDVDIMPGALDLLKALKKRKLKTAVFTNKLVKDAQETCHFLKITPLVETVIGAGDTDYRKPDPRFTQYALEQLNANTQNTILIGDSPFDIETGNAAGLDVYCVATGTHPIDVLKANTPAAKGVFNNMHTLGKELFNL